MARDLVSGASLLLVAIFVCFTGCAGPGLVSEPEPAQGVNCRVVKLVGDFTMDALAGQREPLAAPVHVFRGRVKPFEKPNPEHGDLVRVVQTDDTGRVQIALPPGEYTLIPDIDGILYLNNWMADGSWATVTVVPGAWTEYTIEDVRDAIF